MTDYDSPFFITNDRADIDQDAIEDGTAVVWPLSADAKLVRSPERQYCGNYVTYGDKGAATYRHNSTTHALIAAGPNQHRDMSSSFPLVKTKAKAQARGDRQLLDVQDQDVRITTRLENIPSTRVTLAKAGMRLQIKGTHWGPTCDDWHYARIVSAQPKPHSKGDLYDIDLELVMGMPVSSSLSPGPPAPPFLGDVFAGLQHSYAIDRGDGKGQLAYAHDYDADAEVGWVTQPTVGPIAVDQVTLPYSSITVSQAMNVRIHAVAEVGGFYSGSVTIDFYIKVNGATIYHEAASVTSSLLFHTFEGDIRDYRLEAGDVVSIASGAEDANWGNGGTNETFLRVGRGTFDLDGTIGPDWTGP